MAIVEYPALRELLAEIDMDTPHERAEIEEEKPKESTNERLSFQGETPEWAEQAETVMSQIEEWRGLKFTDKVVIHFQDDAGYDSAGWYDPESKRLVVGKGGSQRFGKGVMLHESAPWSFDLAGTDRR